jgi:hypothetical protein
MVSFDNKQATTEKTDLSHGQIATRLRRLPQLPTARLLCLISLHEVADSRVTFAAPHNFSSATASQLLHKMTEKLDRSVSKTPYPEDKPVDPEDGGYLGARRSSIQVLEGLIAEGKTHHLLLYYAWTHTCLRPRA